MRIVTYKRAAIARALCAELAARFPDRSFWVSPTQDFRYCVRTSYGGITSTAAKLTGWRYRAGAPQMLNSKEGLINGLDLRHMGITDNK
jgi:hypothetical protein